MPNVPWRPRRHRALPCTSRPRRALRAKPSQKPPEPHGWVALCICIWIPMFVLLIQINAHVVRNIEVHLLLVRATTGTALLVLRMSDTNCPSQTRISWEPDALTDSTPSQATYDRKVKRVSFLQAASPATPAKANAQRPSSQP